MLFSTAYFPSIPWFSLFLFDSQPQLEFCEHYVKQTYRNRCKIYSANGMLDLVVPVKREEGKIEIRSVRVSYEIPWQKQHAKALESAYRRSPFYEFYMDDLQWIFSTRETFLFDLNEKILHAFSGMLGLSLSWSYSTRYRKVQETEEMDLRSAIHPKHPASLVPGYKSPVYDQVFQQARGFIPDLSILDLLFHCGPETLSILRTSVSPGMGKIL